MDLTKAVIHHTASPDVPAWQINDWHQEGKSKIIGYHWVIRANGRIEEGRPMMRKGAHAKPTKWDKRDRNYWVGIALTGYDKFTEAQEFALMDLLLELEITQVERHHRYCPGEGFNVEKVQGYIRKYKE